MAPTILLVTSRCWPAPLRFAEALSEAGAAVHLISPMRNRFTYGLAVGSRHTYNHRFPAISLRDVISVTNPSIIVPGDDRALVQLIRLHSHFRQKPNSQPEYLTAKVIEHSLGNMRSYDALMRRAAFIRTIRNLGIRAPATREIGSQEEIRQSLQQLGTPSVLKLDGTSGGVGTVIVHNMKDAIANARILQSPLRRARKKFGAFVRGEGSVLGMQSEWHRPALNVQAWVQGRSATTAFVCMNGRLLGAIHAAVLQESWPHGPATVIRVIHNDEMQSNAEKIALHLGLSGVHGLDYVVDDATGTPWLIEMNPRLTQIAHLALGPGRDLAAALVAALQGQTPAARPPKGCEGMVALFPQEWLRDSKSKFLASGYDDLPRDNPQFLEAILGSDYPTR